MADHFIRFYRCGVHVETQCRCIGEKRREVTNKLCQICSQSAPTNVAREEAERLASDIWDRPSIETREELALAFYDVLLAFRARARREALEEAARLTCPYCLSTGYLAAEPLLDLWVHRPNLIQIGAGPNHECYASAVWSALAAEPGGKK